MVYTERRIIETHLQYKQTGSYIYDIEVYKNLFVIGLLSVETGNIRSLIIYKDKEGNIVRNDYDAIVRCVTDKTLIGYNNWHYDDKVVRYIVNDAVDDPTVIKEFSDKLITDKSFKYPNLSKEEYAEYNWVFKLTYDLMEILRAGFNSKSLKLIGVNLRHSKLQELPIPPDSFIEEDQVDIIVEYNKNDLQLTKLLVEKLDDELIARDYLTDHFNIDLRSQSKSGITKKILDKLYREKLAEYLDKKYVELDKRAKTEHDQIIIGDIVHNYIKYKTDTLNNFLEDFKKLLIIKTNSSIFSDKYSICRITDTGEEIELSSIDMNLESGSIKTEKELILEYDGNSYSIGLGGIHSVDSAGLFESKNDNIILDLDVTSQYPSTILNNKIAPDHLNKDVILEVLQELTDLRIKFKKEYGVTGDKVKYFMQYGLKIAINTFYGLFNSKTYWLFDPRCTFEVTINNQLSMLMLIEELTLHNLKTISANTDGITVYAKTEKLDLIRYIYREWEDRTKFKLEETFYKLYARRDINNYIAILNKDNKVKSKGIFEIQDGSTDKLNKGFNFPIIAKLLNLYFTDGIDPYTILNKLKSGIIDSRIQYYLDTYNIDIYDFCATKKIKGSYVNRLYLQDKLYIKRKYEDSVLYKRPHFKDIKDENNYEIVSSVIRYYISNPIYSYSCDLYDRYRGYIVFKVEELDEVDDYGNTKLKYINYHKDYFMQIFNDYIPRSILDYNINFDYYLNEIESILNSLIDF